MHLGEEADVAAHWKAMVRACRGDLDSQHEAEDCASQALLQALTKSGPAPSNPQAFLVRMANLRAVDAQRSAVRNRKRADRLTAQATFDVVDVAERVVERAEARWLAEQALLLPPDTQAVLRALVAGASTAETANQLGLTRRSVESHLLRARQMLKAVWAKTLAILIGTTWGLKRLALGAPLVVATAALMLVLPFLPNSPRTADSPITAQLERSVPDQPSPAVGKQAAQASRLSHTETGLSARSQSHATSARREVARIDSPAGPVVRVTKQDRGGSDHTPAEAVLACVQNLQVSRERIGC